MFPMFSHTRTDRREAVSEVSAMSPVDISFLPTKPGHGERRSRIRPVLSPVVDAPESVLLLKKQALGSSWLEMAMKFSQISREHCLST